MKILVIVPQMCYLGGPLPSRVTMKLTVIAIEGSADEMAEFFDRLGKPGCSSAAPAPGDVEREPEPPTALATLSERERAILCCLQDGASNQQIADRLHVAVSTVKSHVAKLIRKVGAQNRVQAAAWAVANAKEGQETSHEGN